MMAFRKEEFTVCRLNFLFALVAVGVQHSISLLTQNIILLHYLMSMSIERVCEKVIDCTHFCMFNKLQLSNFTSGHSAALL